MPADSKSKTTIITLRRHKRNSIKTVCVTAYDYPQSIIADQAGVDIILVGDSLGMTSLGYKPTHPLENKILFIVTINNHHKIFNADEIQKIQSITTFIMEQLDEIINDLRKLSKDALKVF